MRWWQALTVAAAMLAAPVARADDAPAAKPSSTERLDATTPPPRRGPSTLRRIAAVGAAIVPGFVVRGAGSFVLGERRTAKRLLVAGAAGAVAAAAGGVAVGASGASGYLVWPEVPLTVIGVGVFLPTWLADIWVAAGGDRVRGGARGMAPWSLELGTTWLHDAYRDRALAAAAARVELGRLGLGAGGLVDALGESRGADAEARWRFLGAAATNGPIADGSRLYLRAGGRIYRDDDDDVTLATAELELVARGELHHLDPLLAGMFLELSTGFGAVRTTYARGAHDLDAILLGRFAWGLYLGRRGELALFYDHRRDHLAGGLYASRASGFIGSFGAAANVLVAGPWAVRAELEVGTSWVSTLALRYHGGAR